MDKGVVGLAKWELTASFNESTRVLTKITPKACLRPRQHDNKHQARLLTSAVARTPPMLGHSMGTLHLYGLPREVQKHLGGGIHPQKISPKSGSEAIW